MSQRINATMHAKKVSHRYYGISKIPTWFYSFVPFKISTGGSSILMPLYLLQLGGNAQMVGIMNSLASLSSMIGSLFWGKLSDKTLRRKVFILFGFFSVSVFLAGLSLTNSPVEFILLNAVYSFFLASTISVPIVLVLRSVRKHSWDYGIGKFNEISGWGWVFGLGLGFVLSKYLTIRQLLLLFALLNIPSLILGAKTIREIPIYVNRKSIMIFGNYVIEKIRYVPTFMLHINLRKPKFGKFYFASFLFWISSGMYFSQFPVLLAENGFGREYIYLAAILNSAVSAFMYLRVGLMLENKDKLKVLKEGIALRLLGITTILIGAFIVPYLLPLAFLSYFLAGYSWSFISISSTSIVGKLAGEKEKGTAMGTFNLINSLGYIIGSFSSGFLVYAGGFTANFGASSLFALLSLMFLKKVRI
ncbi:MFS transporter [Thermococcus paralvinellae]|uniref:Major facilitator superfamily permease n=1 Tax=Thermococcus paralvinellae TaxID=582419 RepID=W0I0F4_9EURY|nr:MFS transporter [Thermococcus paralvinellae]AHF79474.1 Major facilitator superfamily permease [Thermococcus paralvinellae]